MLEDTIKDISEYLHKQQEFNLLDDIIDIYNGVYINYEVYLDIKMKIAEDIREERKYMSPDYKFTFHFEPIILAPELFNYIRSKKNVNN